MILNTIKISTESMRQLCSKDFTKINYYICRGKIYIHKTHEHDLLISSLGVGNLIKCGMLNRNDTHSCEAIRNSYLEETNEIDS